MENPVCVFRSADATAQEDAATIQEMLVSEGIPATVPPSADELAYIRKADPDGFWTGDTMKGG